MFRAINLQNQRVATSRTVQVIDNWDDQIACNFSEFALWSTWSSCSQTCGTGEQTRTRKCEQNCDDVTSDQLTESTNCNFVNCPGY